MKGKRHKHVKKTLNFFKQYFGYDPPYHVVIDGTFCKAALLGRINIMEQMPKYLDAESKLCTTKCILKECQALGSVLYGPLKILQQYDVLPCKHDKAKPASTCMLKFARKKDTTKYMLATQDESLLDDIHGIPGTPVLTIQHGSLTLQGPSSQTRQAAATKLSSSLDPTPAQHAILKQMKVQAFGAAAVEEEEMRKKKKRKGPKGVNPLACKKSKKKKKPSTGAQTIEQKETEKPKKSRKRKRKFGQSNADNTVMSGLS